MVIVLIAAYNEEQALPSILHAIPSHVNESPVLTIVVDDGSTDRTAEVAGAAGCVTLRQDTNRGKGAALKAGIEAIEVHPLEALLLMDGDGQHDPHDIPRIARAVLDGTADMVVGTRYAASSGRGAAPTNRYLVRTATVWLLGTLLDIHLTDPYSGFRCLSPAMLSCLELRGDRYESELEMAFCAARSLRTVVEVPIGRVYGSGMSKMGARRGAALGRAEVVYGYATTILREARVDRHIVSRNNRSAAPT
jgi:glycosyltransferase involved in cell wall biosynthesis